jgi:hypothetical protein
MQFEIPEIHNKLVSTIFPRGYDNNNQNRYHNIGTLSTPYPNKPFSSMGAYGPPQGTVYYTDYNRNYPYELNSKTISDIYPSRERCLDNNYRNYDDEYPNDFIRSNYFSPESYNPSGHVNSLNKKEEFSFGTNYKNIATAYVDRNIYRFSKVKM